MSNELRYHPGNDHPLRAFLFEHSAMAYDGSISWQHRGPARDSVTGKDIPEREVIWFGVEGDTPYNGEYQNGIDAVLLRPTGVLGQRVCEERGCPDGIYRTALGVSEIPTGKIPDEHQLINCPTCHGTGFVPAMIYQLDVVWFEPRTDEWLIGIVTWVNFAVTGFVIATPGEQWEHLSRGITNIVICSLPEVSQTAKPERVSDRDWVWVLEQYDKLKEDK